MGNTYTYLRRSRTALLVGVLAAGVVAAFLAGQRGHEERAVTTAPIYSTAVDLGQLNYQIVTRSGADAASCRAATPRTTPAVIGAPTYVRVGNGLLPDTSVELAVAPGTAGTIIVDLDVNRIPSSSIRAQVEVVVAPTAGDPQRISFGYDGCESGAPQVFNETVTTAPARLALKTTTALEIPALTLTGSVFTPGPFGTRNVSRLVTARMAPMPISTFTSVEQTAPESYFAMLRARQGTNVQLTHSQNRDDGTNSTVRATIGKFPGELDVTLTPTLIDYTARDPFARPLSKPIDLVDIETVSSGPDDPTQTLRATLEQVPARGRLERTSPTRVEVSAPVGPIGAATVSYSSVPHGASAPALAPAGDQYLVARKIHDVLVAKVRVRDLSHAIVDAGDPLAGPDPGTDGQTDKIPTVIEATHRSGPFVVDAAVTSRPKLSPVDVTRTAVVRVINLPTTAHVEFGATTQSFSYFGSDPIGLLTADVTSTEPFVDDATAAHLTVTDFPTGLVGRFDEKGKRFTARVPQGKVGLIELQATSGPDLRLPTGIDGVILEDHDGKYTAFARVSGLRRIAVEWADTMKADIAHLPGPFDVHVDVDDPDTADPDTNGPPTDLDLDIVVRNLPGEALLEYAASKETDCPASPCPKTPTKLAFTGDGPVGSIDLDVVSGQKLIEGGEGNQGANELHGLIKNIPAGTLGVVVDGENKQMTADLTAPAPDFVVELEGCSTGVCGTPVETLRLPASDAASMDGLWLEDLADRYHLLGRVTGLSSLTLNWSDNVEVHSQKKAGPFDIVVNERKLFTDDGGVLPDIPYGSRTSVAIRDLPSQVDLTYVKGAKSLTYHGSAPIGSIEAWLSVDPIKVKTLLTQEVVNAITGRATEAHALITGLPTDVTLNTEFAAEDDESGLASATLTATPSPIGSIYVELTSAESLLSTPAVQAVPVMSTDDGAVFWDVQDGDANQLEAVEDPYVVVARVTQLRSFHFEQYKFGDGFRDKVLAAEVDRASHNNIWIDVLKPDDTKLPRPLDGIGPEYQYGYLRMGMDVPPEKMKFEALITRHANDDFRTLQVETHADGDATSMTVETDAGSESLTAYVAPVPSGATYGDPGVRACISPSSMDCQPDHRVGHAGSDPVSVSLEVAKPLHIDVVRVERKAFACGGQQLCYRFPEFHVHMDVEKFMQASKEVDYEYTNEYFLYVDTQGNGIQGDITDYTSGGPGGGTDLDIHLPAGTEAEHRWIKLEGPPSHSEILAYQVGNNPRGEMSCPSHMDITIDAFEDIDVHIEDEICPEPRIANVLDDATGQPVEVSRTGNGGAAVPVTFHLYGSGFAPITCGGYFWEWPPCTGPAVRVGRVLNGSFIADDRIEIVSRTWHWTDHVEVTALVDPATPVGDYFVWVDNPETGTDRCFTQEVDGANRPCFSVVD